MSLEQAVIAANRFGLGARPGELAQIESDPRGWLLAQLTPEPNPPATYAALPSTADAAAAFGRWIVELGIGGGGLARLYRPQGASPATAAKGLGVEQSYIQRFSPGYAQAVQARFTTAVTTPRPFFERLARFWSNHFTVSAAKPDVIVLAPVFERDAVRPFVCDRFEHMLLSSCRHPGMLEYLDNHLSVGPDSFLARNPGYLPPYLRERMKGLNENLGREILELHTLGVRSGYTQADVTNLARIITGWTVRGPRDIGPDGRVFRFLPAAHQPGAQVLLGRTYADRGEEQGIEALRDLARHPATAQHLATKLVRHFIADQPPPAAVRRVADSFLHSQGDLAFTARALIECPEAWTPGPAKFKTPDDYLVSTVRALGKPDLSGRQLIALLDRMGQRPYWAPGPDGWADTQDPWVGADAVWKRVEWASTLAHGLGSAQIDPLAIAHSALGPTLSEPTRQAIQGAETPAQGLALFLASADFQWR